MGIYEKYILDNYSYCEDGTITRKGKSKKLGFKDKDGYLIMKVKGKNMKVHRVVWVLNNGKFPTAELDHINRDRIDNRIDNLRECDRKQQIHNSTIKPNKNTNVIGIYYDKTKGLKKNYAFHGTNDNKTHRFKTLKEAIDAKKEMESGLYEYL